jgi:hypothetical protein
MMWVMEGLGILLFSYVTWRNLRDNYDSVGVVALGWLMVFGFLIGGKLAGLALTSLIPGFSWQGWGLIPIEPLGGWLMIIGVVCWWAWVNDWKIWLLAEDIIMPITFLMVWFKLGGVMGNFDWREVVLVLEIVIAMVVAMWLKGKYRSFGWYKSGRKGFVFFFLSFLVLELLAIAELIMGGRAWLAGGQIFCGLLFLLGLIMLGRE